MTALKQLLLSLFQVMALCAATQNFTEVVRFDHQATFITTDDHGNIYVVADERLSLYNPAGKRLLTYTTMLSGKITSIDAKDPDRILVFIKNERKIIILNDLFRETAVINLTGIEGLFDITLACLSVDENIWVYNNQENRLIKISDRGDTKAKSALIDDISGIKTNPNFITESQEKLYLNDTRLGLLVFDAGGNFIETIPVKGLWMPDINGEKICYASGRNVVIYDIRSGTDVRFRLPEGDYRFVMPEIHGAELSVYFADMNSVGMYLLTTGLE